MISTCANCEGELCEVDDGIEGTSFFDIIHQKDQLTLLNVVADLFVVSQQLRHFLNDNESTPMICKRCFSILNNCFKLRKQFLNLCHPQATLRPILFNSRPKSIHELDDDRNWRKDDLRSKFRLRGCSVVLTRLPLPHVPVKQETVEQSKSSPPSPELTTTTIKVEPTYNESEMDYEDVYGGSPAWSSEEWSNTVCCTPEVGQPHVISGEVNGSLNRSGRQLRARFKCGQCSKLFLQASARDDHESVEHATREEIRQPALDSEDAGTGSVSADQEVEDEGADTEVPKCLKVDEPNRKSQMFHTTGPTHPDLNKYRVRPTEMFTCDACGQSFEFQAHLKAHMVFDHSKPSKKSDEQLKYKCSWMSCRFSTKAKRVLGTHMFRHTGEKLYKCTIPGCDYGSTRLHLMLTHVRSIAHQDNLDQLLQHYERIKGKESEFVCEQCHVTFAFRAQLNVHVMTSHSHSQDHGDGQLLKCSEPNCKFKSKAKFEFTNHMFTHTGEKWFKCLWTECSFQSISEVDIRRHIVDHIERGRKDPDLPWRCLLCNEQARNPFHLNHLERHVRPQECKFCGKLFIYQIQLNVHMKQHVKKGKRAKKQLKCPSCDFIFSAVSSLHNHVKNARCEQKESRSRRLPVSDSWKKFECDICLKRFFSRYTLMAHAAVHSGVTQRLKCPVCSVSYKTKKILDIHFRQAHEPSLSSETNETTEEVDDLESKIIKITPAVLYTCNHCSKEFEFQALLQAHIQIEHMAKDEFRCGSCDRVTSSRNSLEDHYFRKHTKEMIYTCGHDNCSFSSVDKSGIRQHLRSSVHSKPKLQCQFCGVLCALQGNLDKHVRRKHADQLTDQS